MLPWQGELQPDAAALSGIVDGRLCRLPRLPTLRSPPRHALREGGAAARSLLFAPPQFFFAASLLGCRRAAAAGARFRRSHAFRSRGSAHLGFLSSLGALCRCGCLWARLGRPPSSLARFASSSSGGSLAGAWLGPCRLPRASCASLTAIWCQGRVVAPPPRRRARLPSCPFSSAPLFARGVAAAAAAPRCCLGRRGSLRLHMLSAGPLRVRPRPLLSAGILARYAPVRWCGMGLVAASAHARCGGSAFCLSGGVAPRLLSLPSVDASGVRLHLLRRYLRGSFAA
jgi:hypothetical protein